MSDPSDDAERPEARPVTASTGAENPRLAGPNAALVRLLAAATVDEAVEALCEGRPRDVAVECEAHVTDHAYFLEEGRVAAKLIARLATLAGAPAAEISDALDGLLEEATAEAVAEGPLVDEAEQFRDDPDDDAPPLVVHLSRRLGLSVERVLRLVPRLNALDHGDRHVVFHCVVRGMDARAYAARFDDDPHIVQAMIEQVPRLALEE